MRFGTSASSALGLDLRLDAEPTLEANLHDLEIPVRKRELLPERHHLLIRAVERGSQQLTEAGNHTPDAPRIAFHQRRNGMQGVEQEVGVQLSPQRSKSRIRELRLQLRRLGLQQDRLLTAGLVAQEVVARDAARQHGDEHQEVVHEPEVL